MPDGNVQRIVIPYKPRAAFKPFHQRKQRWSATVAHRRAGKTVARINDLVKKAILCQRQEPRFAYVAPTFAQAKDVAWSYLKRYTAPIPGTIPYENELRVDLPNGGRIRLYGAENYERMRGIYLDGLILDEYGLIDPRAWPEVLRPALADRGGWADFVGTPNGHNHFADLIEKAKADPEWYCAILKASETGLLDQGELDDARKVMTEEQYAAEFECSFDAPIVGSYYGKEIAQAEGDGRICSLPYQPASLVHTAWDIGKGDSTAIWFMQRIGREIHLIDYIQNDSVGPNWYVGKLRERGYTYGEHILPHDADSREKVSDYTYRQTINNLGYENTRVLAREANREPGINAVRLLLPQCWFDRVKCAQGIDCLRNYRRQWDDRRKVFSVEPLHDWASHGADAFRYLATGLPTDKKPKPLVYRDLGFI